MNKPRPLYEGASDGRFGSPTEAVGHATPSPAPSDPQQQLSIPQVAGLLQCSERWLYGKIRAGELRATHLGRAVRVSRGNLQRFLDEQPAWVPPHRRVS